MPGTMQHLPVPIEALSQHLAILGKVGSGKTYAAKGIVEHLLRLGRRVCIIDPVGVWHGLRSSADGQAPGFPVVVFGGEHGDVPITEDAGARLAELIAERNMPCVIDLSDFTGGERHRFMTDFARTLHARNRAPLHLVIDEADEVAPQNPLPETKRMLHEIDRIVRRGRVRGFRVMLITQRPAVLHKNVLTQANTLVAMRLQSPQDRKAIEEWVKGQADVDRAREVMASLSGLQRGEGWVWSPEHGVLERIRFPAITTFDSSRTPEDGETVAEPKALAAVDVEELRAMLAPAEADTSNRAEECKPSDPAAIEAAWRAGYERGLSDGRLERAEETRARQAAIDAALGYLVPFVKREGDDAPVIDVRRVPEPPTIEHAPAPGPAIPHTPADAGAPAQRSAAPRQPSAAGALLPTTRKILDAIHGAYPVALTFPAAAARAGASRRSSQFKDYLRQLQTSGEVEEVGGRFRSAPGYARPVDSGGDPLESWAGRLPPSYGAMLRAIGRAPRPLSKDEIASRAGVSPTSSGLTAGLRELADLALIERGGDGRYRLAEGLAVEGRR